MGLLPGTGEQERSHGASRSRISSLKNRLSFSRRSSSKRSGAVSRVHGHLLDSIHTSSPQHSCTPGSPNTCTDRHEHLHLYRLRHHHRSRRSSKDGLSSSDGSAKDDQEKRSSTSSVSRGIRDEDEEEGYFRSGQLTSDSHLPAQLKSMYESRDRYPLCEPLEGEAAEVWELAHEQLLEELGEETIGRYDVQNFYGRFVMGCMFESTQEKRVKTAVARIIKTIRWREKHNVDDIMAESFPLADVLRTQLWPMRLLGPDVNGHAVVLIRLGECDWRAASRAFSSSKEIVHYLMFHQEVQFKRLQAMGVSSRQVILFDLGGLSMADYRIAYSNGLGSIFEMWASHYPESVEAFYFLNAPWVFRTLYNILKGLVEPDTLEKVHVRSEPIEKTHERLAEMGIDPSLLPTKLGGQDLGQFMIPDGLAQIKVENGEESQSLAPDCIEMFHYQELYRLGYEVPEDGWPYISIHENAKDESNESMENTGSSEKSLRSSRRFSKEADDEWNMNNMAQSFYSSVEVVEDFATAVYNFAAATVAARQEKKEDI